MEKSLPQLPTRAKSPAGCIGAHHENGVYSKRSGRIVGIGKLTSDLRVSLVDSERGLLDSSVAEYPLHRRREDPEYATQSHEDHMGALASASREVLKKLAFAVKESKPSHLIPRDLPSYRSTRICNRW
jgi:hypothetical protein